MLVLRSCTSTLQTISPPLKLDPQSHGRDVFVKIAFKTSKLICAENIFFMAGYFFNTWASDCLLYSLRQHTQRVQDQGTAVQRVVAETGVES
jgi:hypothetical protein